ncbi:Putative beta-lactamase/transpeptidase [Septoria linicola]|uniref:Beta-lactamase/transpeptidase n=1 Tax=Septoria linicola TaxID=215465 RepID=A0A9Q9EMK4_9PEZI|nr:putative beta-lactamase/transpeptidase [Septoria linicola]USW54543.1 Putative beta-lactamase/transpeptidase [Septoria linicola]
MASEKERENLLAEIDLVLRDNVKYGGMVAIAAGSGTPYSFKTDLTGGMNDAILFGVGSITSIFVAVVVLQLVEEAKLRHTDSVQQDLPVDTYCGIENASTATIQQLLSHTAGIDSWEDDSSWLVDGRGANADVSRTWRKTETLDYIRRPRQTAPDPGSWYYSNTNYTLLGLIIESVTGSTAEGEICRRILEPLQMSCTFVEGFEDGPHNGASRRYHYASKQFCETAGISADFSPVSDDFIDVTGSNLSVS